MRPPQYGADQSGVSTWPSSTPRAAKGMSPTSMSQVMRTQSSAGRRTPGPSRSQEQQGHSEQRHGVRRERLGADVGARGERREAQLTVPAHGALAGDAGAAREDRRHGAERGEPDHVVERRREAGPSQVGDAAVGDRDEEVEDEREAQRHDEEALAAKRAQQFDAGVGQGGHADSFVEFEEGLFEAGAGDLDVTCACVQPSAARGARRLSPSRRG